ncbi:MAG: gamma-glutamyltransferase [Cyclobacteriaceae bacterium]
MKHAFPIALVFFIVSCQPNKNSTYVPREIGEVGKNGMVVTAHPLATKAGVDVLKAGGNAYDAAIAVQFALAVTLPRAGNIGGGGFALIRESNGDIASLDFREKAPQLAFRDMYLDVNGDVNKLKSRIGHMAAGVPGTVAGMWELHQQYGSMPWSDLIRPALRLAYEGYALTDRNAFDLNDKRADFEQVNTFKPWVLEKSKWLAGDTVVQRDLATTLSYIQKNGRDGFYKGIVADQISKEMIRGKGVITKSDLEKYEAIWREPITGSYKGHKVIAMPPPSSGGVAVLQLLQGAELFDLKETGHNTAKSVHIMTELERRVYADRATYLGDPDFYNVPVDMLLDPGYNKERYATIERKKKTASSAIKEGKVDIIESVQTTHFSIVDKQGNAIALTTTLNGYFGCKVMVKGAGFFLNNEMDDFSAKPGIPNQFGLVGAEANAIAPEKRMLSSMTPTIVEKDDSLFMVTGTPGGSTIITSVFQSIINVVDYNMSMQDAVNARRVHSQWLPDIIVLEEKAVLPADTAALVNMGHILRYRENIGSVDAIKVRSDGSLEGAADYTRGDDYAEGF